mgnify:CR=1 FL=1
MCVIHFFLLMSEIFQESVIVDTNLGSFDCRRLEQFIALDVLAWLGRRNRIVAPIQDANQREHVNETIVVASALKEREIWKWFVWFIKMF